MARRRRSIFSQFRSVSRNLRTIVSSLAGLGILGTVGYFSWPGLDGFWSTPLDPPEAVSNIVVELTPKSPEEIKIGTFNIENFGKSQLEKPEVIATLADIAMGVDVLAIQEISNRNGNALHHLVAKMNEAQAGRYEYLVSPLLGTNPENKRTDTEQFGFVYDTTRVELIDKQHYGFVVSAKKFRRKFNRLPVVASFKVVDALSRNPFTFSLVTFHNVPDGHERWQAETEALADVYREVRSILTQEDDIILLGDFNANHEQIKSGLRTLNVDFQTAITVEKTNVIQTKSYDNLVFDALATTEFIEGRVFDFTELCRRYQANPDDVSDHFPVIGTFGIEENKKIERIASK